MSLCKEIAYGAERDKSIVPSFICFVLIIGALVAAISMYGREHYLFSLGSLMVGVGASVSLLLNSHARKRGCIATWGEALQKLPSDVRSGVRIDSNSNAVRKFFDSLMPGMVMRTLRLCERSDGALQLVGATSPQEWLGQIDFGATTMLVQRVGKETALRGLFLLSQLLKEGSTIILVDAHLLGKKGDEWTNGTTVLRVEDVFIQGPRMWFTGPWKPGYIMVLSSRKNLGRHGNE